MAHYLLRGINIGLFLYWAVTRGFITYVFSIFVPFVLARITLRVCKTASFHIIM